MSAYATRSSTDYSPSFDYLNTASVRMKSKTITAVAAMYDVAAVALLEQQLCSQVPQAAGRLRYIADKHAIALGNIIDGFDYY